MRRFLRLLMEHVRDFFTNWREYEGPLWTKLRLTARNRVLAFFSTVQCCGHPGQPGC